MDKCPQQFSIGSTPDQSLPLRILHISSAQSFGGGERYLVDLANALAARGHDVYAAVRPDSPLRSELTLPKENLKEVPLRNSLDAKSANALFKFVRNHKIQIVHAHMARDYPLAAYAARRNRGVRLIVTRHVLFPLNRLHKVTLARVARVIAVSEAVGRHMRAQRLVPSGKVTVVHNGIDLDRVARALNEFERRNFCRGWDVPEHRPLIGSVGALTTLKGHDDFLRAAVKIAETFPNAFFVIAGTDSSSTQAHRTHLERLIREYGLSDRVRMIGWMDDLPSLFCALDVFVSASRTESFGLAIVEAMASGAAVVATETEGAKEIIRNGETGLLVPLGDVAALAEGVKALLTNGQERGRISKQAREVARANFSLERMVDETERIYSAVMED
ncbi:MAG: glycosyltransferase family 4 protein [Acidobacteriota bacterium]